MKRKGTPNFEYSFVSSFQRNKAGRYLFYNLADLDSGEKSHHALVDRSLLGLTPRPGTAQDGAEGRQPSSRDSCDAWLTGCKIRCPKATRS